VQFYGHLDLSIDDTQGHQGFDSCRQVGWQADVSSNLSYSACAATTTSAAQQTGVQMETQVYVAATPDPSP